MNLDYIQDTNGKYIVRHFVNDLGNDVGALIKNEGNFTENVLISTKFFDKKLKHNIDDTVRDIRNKIMSDNRLLEKDIVSEKFLLEIKSEEEFNPLFKSMTPKEIGEYTKNSKKVRINLSWEIFILPKSHLLIPSIKNSIKKLFS